MSDDKGLAKYFEQEFSIACSENSTENLKEALSERINQLLLHDPKTLINIFYRLDVSESKMEQLLSGNDSMEASRAIAEAVIARQMQKLKSRNDYPANNESIDENERW